VPDPLAFSDARVTAIEALSTLFALGREVTSVLDLDELLAKIPQLIARLTKFHAFAVYLLDDRGEELRIAYSVGYPADVARTLRVKAGHGLVGAAVREGQPLLVNDVRADPRYVEAVPGSRAELVVPLRRKGRVIGALNLLSDTPGQFTETDEAVLRQFAAHVAVAIENARLFERERRYTSTLETLAEIAREFASILDLDELLARIASLIRRVIDYRTFGIVLLDEETNELEMKMAVRYGERMEWPRLKVGSGLVGYAALHKEPVLVPDVSVDPRYIEVVPDVRSELVIPLLLKERCIGVFDLESPELDAFDKSDVEILTLLASQAAVAIENARLYETIRRNKVRLEKELRFAQRVQAALLPIDLPKRLKDVEVAARFAPARELGGDLYDFLAPEPNSLVVAVGDVSGKGVPAGLVMVMARSILHSLLDGRANLRTVAVETNRLLKKDLKPGMFLSLLLAWCDSKTRTLRLAGCGHDRPLVFRARTGKVERLELGGTVLGVVADNTKQVAENEVQLEKGDQVLLFTDGVTEAQDAASKPFGLARLEQTLAAHGREAPPSLLEHIQAQLSAHARGRDQHDDITLIALRRK